jgi:hypothetical protein
MHNAKKHVWRWCVHVLVRGRAIKSTPLASAAAAVAARARLQTATEAVGAAEAAAGSWAARWLCSHLAGT